jgi:hypothetical protein
MLFKVRSDLLKELVNRKLADQDEVNVEKPGGQPLPYAEVEIYDNNENFCSNQTTDFEGTVRYIVVIEYTQNETTTTTHTPHKITASKLWYRKESHVRSINNNKEITIALSDNSQPIADFIVEIQGDLYSPFIFNASSSTDLEDPSSDLQVRWDFKNDGIWDTDWNTSKTAVYQHYISEAFMVLLEVRDNDLLTNNKILEIQMVNVAPNAVFEVFPKSGNISQTFNFNAGDCSDIEDALEELQVRWDFDSDNVWDSDWNTTKTATYQYDSPGTYITVLELRDTEGSTVAASREIIIINEAPKALFTATPLIGNKSDVFSFDASSSSDLEDPLEDLQIRWDFIGDGTWETEWSNTMTATHEFSAPNYYFVTLEVMDSHGDATTATVTVTVFGDTDGDGTPDHEDEDDDNDGYLDEWEILLGSDPKNPLDSPLDTDGDGLPDGDENNSQPWMDTDDDGDGIQDLRDPKPKEPKSTDKFELMDYWWILLIITIVILMVLIIWMKKKPKETLHEAHIDPPEQRIQPLDQTILPQDEPINEPPIQPPPPPPPGKS